MPRRALGASATTMGLFGLSHIFALVNEDLAVLFFSIFIVLSAIGLIVASASLLRHAAPSAPVARLALACGVRPLLTIPAGAAIGDVPHFIAIAVWGLTWIGFGLALRSAATRPSSADPATTSAHATA